jgi:hypothetical protein
MWSTNCQSDYALFHLAQETLAMTSATWILVLVTSVVQIESLSSAESPDENVAKKRAEESIKLAKQHAAEYELYSDTARKMKLMLVHQPILRWTNPVPQEAGTPTPEVYGGVFIWTFDGRPEVIASIHKWYSPYRRVSHEFHSLSSKRIIGLRGGRQVWSPSRAGIQLKPIPGADSPADSPIKRLRQMRALARGFSADKTNSQKRRSTLRLLPQPLYRYQSTDPNVLDGAVFAFVESTDPEIILLIEARQTSGGYRWQFAAARMNHLNLRLRYGEREVWSIARRPYKPFDPRETYWQIYFELEKEAAR